MYIPPMIIPKKDGCCDEQKPNLPCCENLMAIYPPGRRCSRSPRWRRRRHSPRWRPRSPRCHDQIIKVPIPITKYKYLDPIRVPDLILPPLPRPPPRRPKGMMIGGPPMMGGGKYCNCRGRGCGDCSPCRGCGEGSGHPHYKCVCKKY